MKRILIGILLFCLLTSFQFVFADGTCGTNVKYKIDGNKISFTKADMDSEAILDSGCVDVFRRDWYIRIMEVGEAGGQIRLPADSSELFSNLYVREMFLANLDTSKVTNMARMFYHCGSLMRLDVSGWDTSNVTNMADMFIQCNILHTITLGKNTVNKNIFKTLVAYDSVWYYIRKDNNAAQPLTLGSIRRNGTLFDNFNADTMSGTWTDKLDYEVTGGTCGMNVRYLSDGYTHTIGFTKEDSDSEAIFDSSCVNVYGTIWEVAETDEPIRLAADSSGLFSTSYIQKSVQEMDLSNLDTSNVTNMSQMFLNCDALMRLDISGWDTSNVTNMYFMFGGCSKFTELDVSGWDTSTVTNMEMMFYGCSGLTDLDVSGWDTSSVTNMAQMFYGCSSLTSLELSGWDTSNVINMEELFRFSSLNSLNVSGWDMASVTNIGGMFSGCSSLTSLDLSGWDTSNVAYMAGLFNGCSSLTSLDVSGWDTSGVTYMAMMFLDCSSLTSLDLSGWDTSNVTSMYCMFYRCSSLKSLDMSGWNTSSIDENSLGIFQGCSSLHTITLGKNTVAKDIFWTLPAYDSAWYYIQKGENAAQPLTLGSVRRDHSLFTAFDSDTMAGTWTDRLPAGNTCGTNIKYMIDGNTIAFTKEDAGSDAIFDLSCVNVFGNDESITIMEVGRADELIKLATDSSGVFSNSSFIREMYLNYLDTSKMTNMADMFSNCSSVINLYVNGWNTSNVTDMSHMFMSCSSLTGLDVSGWNTSNVTNTQGMFSNCSSLTSLNVSGWDTPKVSNMGMMFCDCNSLTSLDLSGWKTSNVINMADTFSGCSSLHTITLGRNTAGKNIFTSLPTYDSAWYYIYKDTNAVHPLTFGSIRSNGTLFTKYDADTMAGTWSDRLPEGNTCGTNVEYMIEGNTISFTKADVDLAGIFDSGCVDVFRNDDSITIMEIGETNEPITLGDTYQLFINSAYIREMYLSNLDVFNVTNMASMFQNCYSLADLDVNGWNTSNVTNMGGMFEGCSSLTNLNVNEWDISNVTNMGGMFNGCSSLTDLNVSEWDISNVTNMEMMFDCCSSLTDLNVSEWDTSNITNMGGMFNGCSSLTNLNVSKWDTSNVTNMGGMFTGCSSLTDLNVSEWDTSNVTNMEMMFDWCVSMTSLDVSGWNTSNVTNMFSLFNNCGSLTSLDVSGWDTSSVTNMGGMFYDCNSLTSLDMSGWNTSNVTNMANTFLGCSSLHTITLGKNTTGKNIFTSLPAYNAAWYYMQKGTNAVHTLALGSIRKNGSLFANYDADTMAGTWSDRLPDGNTCGTNVKYMIDGNTISFTKADVDSAAIFDSSCAGVFRGNSSITIMEVGETEEPISLAADSSHLFNNLYNIQEMRLANLDTSNVTRMVHMFNGCSSLTSLDVSGWDTSNVTNMNCMFLDCSSLVGLNASEWNTSNVTNMADMFLNCNSLANLDLRGWDTSVVIYMGGMFRNCGSLTSLDVSGWNTSMVIYMERLFSGCSSLTDLDVSGWNTSSVGYWFETFNGCSSLHTITLGKNTVSKNIFTSLPEYNAAWYYIQKDTNAAQPLPLWSVRKDGKLFTAYDYDLMAGTWSVAGNTCGTNVKYSSDGNMIIFTKADMDLDAIFDSSCVNFFRNDDSVTIVEVRDADETFKLVEDAAGLFLGSSYIEEMLLANLDTSKVTNMNRMFSNCSSLTSLDLSGWDISKVTNTEDIFSGCFSLTSLDLSEWDTSSVIFFDNAFSGCSSLHAITLGNNIANQNFFTSLPVDTAVYAYMDSSAARWARENSRELHLIGYEGFQIFDGVLLEYTGSDEKVVIPDIVSEIGPNAFEKNTTIASLEIPESVTAIGASAFYDCDQLETVVIPNGVTSIGKSAFSGCDELVEIMIPENVREIGNGAVEEFTVVMAYAGSYAAQWAEENRYTLKLIVTVTFSVANGAWNDETTEDKIVTLTGFKGSDALKLKAEQIPGVGTRPGSWCWEGSWDTVPDTEKALSENMVYSYIYGASTVPGDLSNDGVVNLKDVLLLRNYFLKNGIGVKIYRNPDTSGDGKVNLKDVLLLRNYFLKNGAGVVIY